MKEQPIIMTGEYVRAILEGRKTQTRRPVDMRVPMDYVGPKGCKDDPDCWGYEADDGNWYLLGRGHSHRAGSRELSIAPPHGDAGDRLWVKETWCCRRDGDGPIDGYWYRATDHDVVAFDDDGGLRFRKDGVEASPWLSPICMPRKASRIDLEILNVRVERLQAISPADIFAEGIQERMDGKKGINQHFADAWDAINGKHAPYSGNPWVWVYEHRRIKP